MPSKPKQITPMDNRSIALSHLRTIVRNPSLLPVYIGNHRKRYSLFKIAQLDSAVQAPDS
jgi:hypothetical protein